MSPTTHQKRRSDVLARVRTVNTMYSYCRVVGCGRPASAGTSEGLNQRFCRRHEEQMERHGSPYRKSFTAAELRPHRDAARAWVVAQQEDPPVRMAINAVADLYYRAGPRVKAFRLAGLPPEQRARALWASLRHREVDAREVVAIWLAVESALRHETSGKLTTEYKLVQAGKLLHRMAGGAHKRWQLEDGRGVVRVKELHKHTHSRGRVLRHLGEQLEAHVHWIVAPFAATD